MSATRDELPFGSMIRGGKWIILACAAISLIVAFLLTALQPPRYQTEIRVAMAGAYASSEVVQATYEEFVGWRSREMPPPAAPPNVSISESYNATSQTATLKFNMSDNTSTFAQSYFQGLQASLQAFSSAKIARSERKLAILSDLNRSLGLQGSDYLATLATDLSFFLEDVKADQAIATISPPPAPQEVGQPNMLLSLLFALVVGIGTGILFLISRALWLAQRAGRPAERV